MLKLVVSGCSDKGLKRSNNQDSIYVDAENGIFVQADGMGGHKGGKEASSIAVSTIASLLSEGADYPEYSTEDIEKISNHENSKRSVYAAILAADMQIKELSTKDELKGMGSTVDVLYISEGKAVIGHVGDSRVYRLRADTLNLLTNDHSLINELRNKYHLQEDYIESIPYGNRITRALGYLADRHVDIIEEDISKNDIYLLCSDGLTSVLDDNTIKNIIMQKSTDLKLATKDLIDASNEAGGPDNISVVLIKILDT